MHISWHQLSLLRHTSVTRVVCKRLNIFPAPEDALRCWITLSTKSRCVVTCTCRVPCEQSSVDPTSIQDATPATQVRCLAVPDIEDVAKSQGEAWWRAWQASELTRALNIVTKAADARICPVIQSIVLEPWADVASMLHLTLQDHHCPSSSTCILVRSSTEWPLLMSLSALESAVSMSISCDSQYTRQRTCDTFYGCLCICWNWRSSVRKQAVNIA